MANDESVKKLKALLMQLFQYEAADLDYGIPKLMNFKRKEIEKFVENGLFEATESAFKGFTAADQKTAHAELKALADKINEIDPGIINDKGEVRKNKDMAKVKEYIEMKKQIDQPQSKMDDVYSNVYEFFNRYYEEGDFISKARDGGRAKYRVPYNGEEVLLHWATKDQYYVKTDDNLKKHRFEAGSWHVTFTVLSAEVEANNVKTGDRYFILDAKEPELDEKKKELVVFFNYRQLTGEEAKEYGTKKKETQQKLVDEAVKAILKKGSKINALAQKVKVGEDEITLLEKQIDVYIGRNTTDYFIHKNLRGFLESELDFYLKNEVLKLDDIEGMDARHIMLEKAKLKAIRQISGRIIAFLSQIEEFQKKLWEKKKFVLKTEYVVTIDKLPDEMVAEVLKNKAQLAEWDELGFGKISKKSDLVASAQRTLGDEGEATMKMLPVDTKHFDADFKMKLLAKLSEKGNLDGQIDGLLIKSENWQALNLLQERYRKAVDNIYIDPPYNTGKDEFLYKDNYQHSSWLTLMSDRLEFAKNYLTDKGIISVSISDIELSHLNSISNYMFGEENFIANMVWNTEGNIDNQSKIKGNHEYILLYGKNERDFEAPHVIDPNIAKDSKLYRDTIENSITKNGPANPPSTVSLPIGFPADFDKGEILPNQTDWPRLSNKVIISKGKITNSVKATSGWSSKDLLDEFIENKCQPIIDSKENKTWFKITTTGAIYIYKTRSDETSHVLSVIRNVGTVKQMSGQLAQMGFTFSYPKPIGLIEYVTAWTNNPNGMHLDFFAGSGTLSHAIININKKRNERRKFIVVEMASYFETIILPRLKKIAYAKEWIDNKPTDTDGYSGLWKYFIIEQYEDTLNNISFKGMTGAQQKTLEQMPDYFINYMLDYETRESPSRLNIEAFEDPFDYQLKILSGGERWEKVDLVETFNYLLGLEVDKVQQYEDQNRKYVAVFGRMNGKKTAVVWRVTKGLDKRKDKKFIESEVLKDYKPERIFVNGDSAVERAEPVEIEFKRRMGA